MAKKNTQEQKNLNQPSLEQDQVENDSLLENETDQVEDQELPVNNLQPSSPFYGNKDYEKKHLLQPDWAKKVCVWQCQIEQLNGGQVEVPNTHQLQTYDPKIFEKLISDEKGKPSFFSESKMKVTVLHDPR